MFDKIIHPFAVAVAWVWVKIHDLLVLLGFNTKSGLAWVISIVLLTLIVRLAIVPLFLKQIKSSRAMQAVQPEMQRIQAKYKGKKDPVSRQKQAEETQALYKKYKVSPFASCFPLLVQMPILFAMYRAIYAVKDIAAGTYTYAGIAADHLGPINQELATAIDDSTVFGVRLSHTITSGDGIAAIIVFCVFILVMMVLQFYAMRVSMVKNMPPAVDPNNPMVQSQKSMLYMMPLMYIFSGAFFQMGVLVYMITASVWAVGQSLWTIRFMPTPGSPAYTDLAAKRYAKYTEWAKPFFADYDAARAQLPAAADDPEVVSLNEKTFAEAAKRAKSQKVATDFPESMTDGDKVSVLRNLATQEWTTLPDEMWMRGVKEATSKAEERRAQQAKRDQNKKKSREERLAEAERQRAREARKQAAAQPTSIDDQELERRRQERRRQRREQRKNKGN